NGTDIYALVFSDSVPNYRDTAAAKWNGNSWSTLAVAAYSGGFVAGLALAQGNLYAAGELNLTASSFLHLGQLVQGKWVPVGGGIDQNLVVGIASDGTNLIVSGSFFTIASQAADGFAIWDGAQWIAPSAASRGGFAVKALTTNPGE